MGRAGLRRPAHHLSGFGDSPAAPDTDENVTYPPSGLDDLAAAMQALADRTGAQRFVIAGLCSGGDYAFQLGARDWRVATAVIMNPRTFCMLDLRAVESASTEPPAPSVDSVPGTLGTMARGGVDTLLLVSERDPGVAYVDTHQAGEMGALAVAPGFRRIDLPGADHTFTPVSSQRRVLDLVTVHLAERYFAWPRTDSPWCRSNQPCILDTGDPWQTPKKPSRSSSRSTHRRRSPRPCRSTRRSLCG